MKKVYKKPELLVENFILSDYIANCGIKITSFSEVSSCLSAEGDDKVILDILLGANVFGERFTCSVDYEGNEYEGMICKHGSTGGGMVSLYSS